MAALLAIEATLAIALVSAVLLQQRGTGLGGVFGSDLSFYRSRRGIELWLQYATFILALLFVGVSILLFIRK